MKPLKSIELVKSYPEMTDDVVRIIQMHHEKYDGSGFPRGLTQEQIPPLPAIFIVAEEIVNFLYMNNRDLSLLPIIIDQLDVKYEVGHFSKIIGYTRKALAIASNKRTSDSPNDKGGLK